MDSLIAGRLVRIMELLRRFGVMHLATSASIANAGGSWSSQPVVVGTNFRCSGFGGAAAVVVTVVSVLFFLSNGDNNTTEADDDDDDDCNDGQSSSS